MVHGEDFGADFFFGLLALVAEFAPVVVSSAPSRRDSWRFDGEDALLVGATGVCAFASSTFDVELSLFAANQRYEAAGE